MRMIRKPRTLAIEKVGKENPCLSRTAIAEHFSVSREYVRQVLKRAHIRTKALHLKPIRLCRCGNEVTEKYCRYCYECRHIRLICDKCGCVYTRHITDVANKSMRHKHQFHSKECQGRWLGDEYGRNNAGRLNSRKGKSKYDYILPELARRLTSGEFTYHIGKAMGIPAGSVNMLVKKIKERV